MMREARFSYLFSVFILFFSVAGCSSTKGLLDPVEIEMHKTGCYGTCPIYSISLSASGNAEYVGKNFTDKMGKWKKDFSEDLRLVEFFGMVKEENWMQFDTFYPTMISDLPATILTIRFKESTRTIEIHGEHPEELDVYIDKLSEFANSGGWVNMNLE